MVEVGAAVMLVNGTVSRVSPERPGRGQGQLQSNMIASAIIVPVGNLASCAGFTSNQWLLIGRGR